MAASGSEKKDVCENCACKGALRKTVIRSVEVAAEDGHVKCLEALLKEGHGVNYANTNDGRMPLMLAAKNGQSGCVEVLLKAGARVNHSDYHGDSALMLGCGKAGTIKCVKLLLEAGADVNHSSSKGFTALMYATNFGHENIVSFLIKAGADVNKVSLNGFTVMYFSTFSKRHEGWKCIDTLAKAGADVNFIYDGKTPLMWASLQSCDKSAEALIRAGADVNITCDQDNVTALFWAAERDYDWTKTAESLKLLLRSGIRINVRNNKGHNTLEESLSKKSGNVGDIDLILLAAGETVNEEGTLRPATGMWGGYESGQGVMVSLEIAAADGHVKCLEALLNAGADVNYANCENGYTPLIWAGRYGKDKCMELLIKAGADVNIGDSHDDDALMLASNYVGNIKCVKLLLDAGADVNHTNRHGVTPLMYAAGAGHVDIVTLFIENGANVNSVTEELLGAITAIHWSAMYSNGWKCIDTLAKAGADVNFMSDGKTPMMLALQEGENFEKSIEALIKAGADVNIADEEHELTILHQALHAGNGIYKMLIQAGADVNVKRLGSRTPLMDTMDDSNYNCAEALIKAGADVNITCDQGNTALFSAANRDRSWMKTVECVKLLLRSGARINLRNDKGHNAVEDVLSTQSGEVIGETFLTLIAAGETVNQTLLADERFQSALPDYQSLRLKHICRMKIREHLLKLDPHIHLFYRVPRLGLPATLTNYLLFNMSIERKLEKLSESENN